MMWALASKVEHLNQVFFMQRNDDDNDNDDYD